MATLKGAYQRFVTSLIRIWRREQPQESQPQEPRPQEAVEAELTDSQASLSEEDNKEENKICKADNLQPTGNEPETFHSAPDLLETRRTTKYISPIPKKKRPSNLRKTLSIRRIPHNNSEPNLQLTQSVLRRQRNNSSPVFNRKASTTDLYHPEILESLPYLRVQSPTPDCSREISPHLTHLRVQPPTPDSSRESSPILTRRELSSSSNVIFDHHLGVLQRHLGDLKRRESSTKVSPKNFSGLNQKISPQAKLRREKSVNNLLRYSPTRRPKRESRPKSVSDILTPEFQTRTPKLKKSASFLKLNQPVSRKHYPTTSDKPDNHEQAYEKHSEFRLRTFTLVSKISKFASKRIDGTLRKRTKSDVRTPKITIMKKIEVATDKSMPVEPFLARLRDYNTYYKDKEALQFKWKQDKDGNLVVDGMLSIYWGLKRAIRLQMQDTGAKIRPQSQLGFAQAEAVRKFEEKTTGEPIREENVDIVMKNETLSGRLMRRKLSKPVEVIKKGEEGLPKISIENGILGDTRHRSYDKRRMGIRLKNGGEKVHVHTEDTDGLMRQKSVILRKRLTNRSARKRFSINGHAYNYRTSVFTPAYASVTNIRVTSRSTCDDVIKHLLNKFRVENSFEEFSLFLVQKSGERRELARNEHSLVTRVLAGPNEDVCKIFVMDRHMHQDISSDVAQYIKLDLNILQIFVKKFSEEEERETEKMKERYGLYREMLERRILELSAP